MKEKFIELALLVSQLSIALEDKDDEAISEAAEKIQAFALKLNLDEIED